jgi:hypothetical protein
MSNTRDTLTLHYRLRDPIGEWQQVREAAPLEAPPCNYGGVRLRLRCPGCVACPRLLYSVGGRFQCRGCLDLAYTSTREDDLARSQ